MLTQALRAEGMESPARGQQHQPCHWDKLLRFSGNKTRSELLTDIGLGKRIASIVAKRLAMTLLSEERPETRRLADDARAVHGDETVSQGAVTLDGSENASVSMHLLPPRPGDSIVGYLGRGEGLVVHNAQIAWWPSAADKDSERFIAVDWSDEPVRPFETGMVVTVNNGKGVLARVAAALANSEADITHVDMDDEAAQDATDLRFVIAVRDRAHLDAVLRNLAARHRCCAQAHPADQRVTLTFHHPAAARGS
jgi:guanosine-3',5'-bis(diphosphate) 3'-pyrophosphohydrolase